MKKILFLIGLFFILIFITNVYAVEFVKITVDNTPGTIGEGLERDVDGLTIKAVNVNDQPGTEFDSADLRIIEILPANQYTLDVGESVIVAGREVTLSGIVSTGAKLGVDGVAITIPEGTEREFRGLAIKILEIHNEPGIEFDWVRLRIIEGAPININFLRVGDSISLFGKTITLDMTGGGTIVHSAGGVGSPSVLKMDVVSTQESQERNSWWVFILATIALIIIFLTYRNFSVYRVNRNRMNTRRR